jgi:hypothetical protein
MNPRFAGLCGVLVLVACGQTSAPDSLASSDDPLAPAGVDTTVCSRPMRPANRNRKVVVTHPYSAGPKKKLEVLELHTTGELTKTGVVFQMGPPSYTPIVFTPDGEIGLVPQDDGTIGIFRFDAFGMPQVVDGAFQPGCDASHIVMSPSGNKAYLLDPDTDANGGGVYELDIACDGTVTAKGRVVPGGSANAMAFMPRSRTEAILTGVKAFDSTAGNDTFALDMHAPSLKAQGTTFGAAPGIASSIDVTADGKYALITDDSLKAGNRVGVITLESMKPRQIIDTKAPFQVVASVYGNAALVVNGDSADQLTVLKYDASNAETPFADGGAMNYTLPRPELPGAAVQITRGALKGRVLVTELKSVRQVQFMPDGGVADVSQVLWDKTDEGVIGTLGVQP